MIRQLLQRSAVQQSSSVLTFSFAFLATFCADSRKRSEIVVENVPELISTIKTALEHFPRDAKLFEYAFHCIFCIVRFSEKLKGEALNAGIDRIAVAELEKNSRVAFASDAKRMLERLGIPFEGQKGKQDDHPNQSSKTVEEELLKVLTETPDSHQLKRLASKLRRMLDEEDAEEDAGDEDDESGPMTESDKENYGAHVEEILDHLKDGNKDADIVASALRALMNLVPKESIARYMVYEDDGFARVVIPSLAAYPDKVRTQLNGISLAHNLLLTGEEQDQNKMVRAATKAELHDRVKHILRNMRVSKDEDVEELIETTTTVLTIYMRRQEVPRREMFTSEVYKDVMECMKLFPSNLQLQERGLVSLGKMCTDNDRRTRVMHDAGVTAFVVNFLHSNLSQSTADIAEYGLWVLRIMARYDEARRAFIVEQGGVELTTRAKDLYANEPDLVNEADRLNERLTQGTD